MRSRTKTRRTARRHLRATLVKAPRDLESDFVSSSASAHEPSEKGSEITSGPIAGFASFRSAKSCDHLRVQASLLVRVAFTTSL